MDPEALAAMRQRIENKIRGGWRDMVREIKDENKLAAIESRVAAGSRELLVGVESAAEHLAREVAQGYVHAAQRTARAIDAVSPFRFDLADPEVQRWINEQTSQIVSSIVHEQEVVAQRVAALGRARGLSARAISEEVQASIGLNERQVGVVANYRRALESGNYAAARSYELRDLRFDSVMSRTAAQNGALTAEQIDRMVSRYRDAWGRTRAEAIGVSEGTRATAAGVDEAFAQAVEDEAIAAEQVERRWVTRHDNRVRASHRAMNGQVRRLGEPFMSGYGNALMYPGDENAPSDDTAGCRCVVVHTIAGKVAVEKHDGTFFVMKLATWAHLHDRTLLAA